MMNERTGDRSRSGDPDYAPGAPGDREQVFDEEPYLGTAEDRADGDRMARSDALADTETVETFEETPEARESSTVGGALVAGGAGAIAGGAVAGPPGAVVGAVIGAVAGAAAAAAAEHEARVLPEDGGG
jgi:hypothetical protein